eukprot:8440795-Pyramimonas_sp.AAC.1
MPFLHRCPAATMLNYIDDTAIGNASPSFDIAKGVAAQAFTEFREMSKSINATLNVDKVAPIASSKELGRAICQDVGVGLDVVKDSVAYLGVDETAGLKRPARGARPTQKSRFAAARLRLRKVKRFRR